VLRDFFKHERRIATYLRLVQIHSRLAFQVPALALIRTRYVMVVVI